MEITEGSAETPGFKLAPHPYFEKIKNGFRKLKMPRNHSRVNQCSMDMLRSWRANCDLQVFVYETDPMNPDIKEIATVTDYTVGYACKGAKTTVEEKKQITGFINTFTEQSGDENDIKRLAQKLLNRSASNHIISKQESLVLLLGLPIAHCSDRFDTISTSTYSRIQKDNYVGNTFVDKYKRRPSNLYHHSLHEFYHYTKSQSRGNKKSQWSIPHYTGGTSKAVYPPTREYARSVFFVHRPWVRNFSFFTTNWESHFAQFIGSNKCPTIASLSYHRALQRYIDNSAFVEPVTKETQLNEDLDEDTAAFLALTSMHNDEWTTDPEANGIIFNYGEQHDWTSSNVTRSPNTPDGTMWLNNVIKQASASDESLDLPMKMNDNNELCHYEIADLHEDQQKIMAYILGAVRAWENHNAQQSGPYKGLFLTVRGKGGSGKTVLLKTITSVLRRRYQSKTAVQIAAPTGVASHNAGGSTLHHLFGVNTSNVNSTEVSEAVAKLVAPKLEDTVVLLLDERSMISTHMLGKIETVARHCAHNGFRTGDPWGNIPIIIIFGDDKQLPSIGRGVTSIPIHHNSNFCPAPEYNKLSLRGQVLFQQFAQDVMNLPVIKRQHDKQTKLKTILQCTRNDELNTEDVRFLRHLHLDADGWNQDILQKIKKDSLWVFANVEPADQHNMRMLSYTSKTTENPVAWLRAQWKGTSKYRKAIQNHFRDSTSPKATRICLEAKVCLRGRNFQPNWGLFNGAIGTVKEIHYTQKTKERPTPNNGDLPDYVVVDFPHYRGPVWDEKHPRVSYAIQET